MSQPCLVVPPHRLTPFSVVRADRPVGFGPESTLITLEADTLLSCIFY